MAFFTSAEWREKSRNRKQYMTMVRPEGTWVLDSVPPGQYMLYITAQKADDESFGARPLARGEIPVTVPDGA